MRRSGVAAAWVGSVVLAAGVAWWAAGATLSPAVAQVPDLPPATFTVVEGSIGSVQAMQASVSWPRTRPITAAAQGTVTSVDFSPGAQVRAGDTLFTVDLRPVVAAVGAVPSFRDLAVGDRGRDVRQLHHLLEAAGVPGVPEGDVFTGATGAAVRAWQKSLGVEQSGLVGRGDVVYLPKLPAHVVPADGMTVGASLDTGAPVAWSISSHPVVALRLDGAESTKTPPHGAAVDIASGDETWHAVVADAELDEDGVASLRLEGAHGGPACGASCGSVPYSSGVVTLPATVVLTPAVDGPMVPVSAVVTAPDGSVLVHEPDGTAVPVTILASDGSRLIVSGVKAGDVVALFGDPDAEPAPTPTPLPTS